MHLRRGTFKWSMIYDYLQGTIRYWLFLYMPYLLSRKVTDRSLMRMWNAKNECMKQKQCVNCGCSMPALLFTDKGCSIKCHDHDEAELGL